MSAAREVDPVAYAQEAAMWRLANALVNHWKSNDCAGCYMHPAPTTN